MLYIRMLPIYKSNALKLWDRYTINHESITNLQLMDKAALACVEWILKHIPQTSPLAILCGNGNNGGDGLAIARILVHYAYNISVYVDTSSTKSDEYNTNYERLLSLATVKIFEIEKCLPLSLAKKSVVIDCIFGIGLNRPITGLWQQVVNSINQSQCKIVSIDIPSGLVADPSTNNKPEKNASIIKANYTLTFQIPKQSMLLQGWGDYCGDLIIIDIGLSPNFMAKNQTENFLISLPSIKERFLKRIKFSHKGTYGHALIVAGNKGKCGAAILSAMACMKSGAGLVTVHTPSECHIPIYSSIPEVMIEETEIELLDMSHYSAIGIGPGIGYHSIQVSLLRKIFAHCKCPFVLDADALNIISQNPDEFSVLANTILTPHPKEFDRLVGGSANAYERLKKAQKFAMDKKCIVVLKGAHTSICCPDGNVYFNSSGNAGMATAGAGDVLTGIITSLLAQGYSSINAAIIGVCIHGAAGDNAANQKSVTGLLASDIIDNLDYVFKHLEG